MRDAETDARVKMVLRRLYAEYNQSIYDTLLARCQDPLMARDTLKSIFQDVYAILSESGTTDITAIWLSTLSQAHLERRLAASKGGAPLEQATTPQEMPYTPKQIPDWGASAGSRMAQGAGAQEAPPYGPQQMPAQMARQPAPHVYPQEQGKPEQQWQSQPVTMQPQPWQAQQAQTGYEPWQGQFAQERYTPWPDKETYGQGQAGLEVVQRPAQGEKMSRRVGRESKQAARDAAKREKRAESKRKKGKAGKLAAMSGLAALIVGSLWAIAGLLMSMQILPNADLGYQWFNAHIYNVF